MIFKCISHDSLPNMLKRVGESKQPLSYSDCSSQPVSCAAIEGNCTGGLVIEILNSADKVSMDIVQPHSELR